MAATNDTTGDRDQQYDTVAPERPESSRSKIRWNKARSVLAVFFPGLKQFPGNADLFPACKLHSGMCWLLLFL